MIVQTNIIIVMFLLFSKLKHEKNCIIHKFKCILYKSISIYFCFCL